jgi:hypothetical protein
VACLGGSFLAPSDAAGRTLVHLASDAGVRALEGSAADSAARTPRATRARANSSPSPRSSPAGVRRAPTSPPLAAGGSTAAIGEEGVGSAQEGTSDPLVSNGLSSPTCAQRSIADLTLTAKRHCRTSGFVAAGAPTGDYGIDVHIDTGFLGLSDGSLLSAVQDLFVTPLWMALVWAVHALVVMLEWCFGLDLLSSPGAGGLGAGLRRMEASFTGPWLPLALAVASALAIYHGLVRRRVAETLAEVALMVGMMAAGLWVIVDPVGTLGALAQWSNQAAIGTLATAAAGSPEHPARALSASLETVFSSAIEGPWCYLEFGDVEWCREPARLDSRLRGAGRRIAAEEQALVGCHTPVTALTPCAAQGSDAAQALRRSAELLGEAQTNGAIFLALPANGAARNSINDEHSLLRTICQSPQATSCHGPSAAQAEFRTNGGTWSRVGGLILIVAGLLGMLALLGFLALRLLAAAIFSLLYLLLAPAMVLAPAFGDGGRALFRRWSGQLLGSVAAKLVYSFLLGVVLAVLGLLSSLGQLGWWTQWLLMSTLWWGAFLRRHQALGLTGAVVSGTRVNPASAARRSSATLHARGSLAAARWARGKLGGPSAADRVPEPRSSPDEPAVRRALARLRSGATHARAHTAERRAAAAGPHAARERSSGEMPGEHRRAQLVRIEQARTDALAAGDEKHAARLAHRAGRVADELAAEAGEPRERSAATAVGPRGTGPHGAGPRSAGAHAAGRVSPAERARAGLGRARALSDAGGATARGALDRDAEVRREVQDRREAPSVPVRRRSRQAPTQTRTPSRERDPGARAAPPRRHAESEVMRDAREVEAGRKRQLGRDAP